MSFDREGEKLRRKRRREFVKKDKKKSFYRERKASQDGRLKHYSREDWDEMWDEDEER